MKQLLVFVETLVVALVGVAVFTWVNIPLPWLIGSLTATAVWHVTTQRKLFWPVKFRVIAMMLLGYLTGSSFTEEAFLEMRDHIPSMIVITIVTVAFSLLLGWMFSRLTGLDLTSCLMGSVPGGLSQIMLLLDEIKSVNPTIIMFLQSMRVMMIVIIVPIITVFMFGADTNTATPDNTASATLWSDMPWFAFIVYPAMMIVAAWLLNRLRVPTSILLGPMILTIILTLGGYPTPALPGSLVNLAQLFIGVHIGLEMQPRHLPNWKRTSAYTALTVGVLVLFGIGIGYGLTFFYDIGYPTALLSTAPGGMVEMGITAIAVGGDLSVVTSYQLFRLLSIMLVIPFFFKWLTQRRYES
ncbi:hypothetical protein JNUCC1_00663 [Lentibacillus sp. JNUCC-1]|uniref:AbrB family transcriptional regulator n=1 Tax=Lentibacillus sp. JNUCC-1 TaxID=2654513 RepID=UPI00132AF3A8|nr:AbrB family transcriptional regulator [Lentibacillus sp. JNUCC-1]MUV36859.1 hypothetical protein [Lentibacillus sp. JNUCC-1]